VRKALSFNPDLIGITNPFSDFADYALKAAQSIKDIRTDIPIIIGGPHASAFPAYFLKENSPVDFVVRGEGERTLLQLITAIVEKSEFDPIMGLSYRFGTTLKHNPSVEYINDLDSLPFPAYSLIDMERYFKIVSGGFPSRYSFEYPGSEREISLVTSRGCPFQCVFCGNHQHMGRRWRFNSADYVLKQMNHLIVNFRINHFHLEDDNVTLNPERFEKILDGIIAQGWNITWDTPNGVRADGLNEALIKKIKRSGCTYLIVGIESGDQKILNTIIKKNLDLKAVATNLKFCKDAKLDTPEFYIVGFPGETAKEINNTFKFAIRMLLLFDNLPHLCLARPLPGTQLFEICEQGNFLTHPMVPEMGKGLRGEVFKRQMIKTKDFSPEKLEQWVQKFHRKVIVILLLKTFLWVMLHPTTWFCIYQRFRLYRQKGISFALKRIFFGGLFYKNNFLPRRGM